MVEPIRPKSGSKPAPAPTQQTPPATQATTKHALLNLPSDMLEEVAKHLESASLAQLSTTNPSIQHGLQQPLEKRKQAAKAILFQPFREVTSQCRVLTQPEGMNHTFSVAVQVPWQSPQHHMILRNYGDSEEQIEGAWVSESHMPSANNRVTDEARNAGYHVASFSRHATLPAWFEEYGFSAHERVVLSAQSKSQQLSLVVSKLEQDSMTFISIARDSHDGNRTPRLRANIARQVQRITLSPDERYLLIQSGKGHFRSGAHPYYTVPPKAESSCVDVYDLQAESTYPELAVPILHYDNLQQDHASAGFTEQGQQLWMLDKQVQIARFSLKPDNLGAALPPIDLMSGVQNHDPDLLQCFHVRAASDRAVFFVGHINYNLVGEETIDVVTHFEKTQHLATAAVLTRDNKPVRIEDFQVGNTGEFIVALGSVGSKSYVVELSWDKNAQIGQE